MINAVCSNVLANDRFVAKEEIFEKLDQEKLWQDLPKPKFKTLQESMSWTALEHPLGLCYTHQNKLIFLIKIGF